MTPAADPMLRIVSGPHLRATAAGELTLKLSCLAKQPAGWHGTVSLKSARRVPSRYLSRGRSRIVSLGKYPFTICGGTGATVTVRLSENNLALLRRMQTIRVTIRVAASDRSGRVTTVSRLVSLHAPPRRSANDGPPPGPFGRGGGVSRAKEAALRPSAPQPWPGRVPPYEA